jgi:hypothetical protein
MSYPITIVHNVFDDPQEILSLAEKTEYIQDTNNVSNTDVRETSLGLDEIYPELYDIVVKKTLLSFYENVDFFHAQGTCYFHRTVSTQKQNSLTHTDRSLLTSVIYLTKNNNHNGLEIYRPSVTHTMNQDDQCLEKIATINANFNSMIIFPGHYPHKPIMSTHDDQYRYTIRLFIKDLCSTPTPGYRIQSFKSTV